MWGWTQIGFLSFYFLVFSFFFFFLLPTATNIHNYDNDNDNLFCSDCFVSLFVKLFPPLRMRTLWRRCYKQEYEKRKWIYVPLSTLSFLPSRYPHPPTLQHQAAINESVREVLPIHPFTPHLFTASPCSFVSSWCLSSDDEDEDDSLPFIIWLLMSCSLLGLFTRLLLIRSSFCCLMSACCASCRLDATKEEPKVNHVRKMRRGRGSSQGYLK